MAHDEMPNGPRAKSKLLTGVLIALALVAMALAPTVFSSTQAQPNAPTADADLAGSGCGGGPESPGGCGGVGNEPAGGCGGGGCAIPQPEATAAPDCSDCDGNCDDNCPQKADCKDCDGDCDNCPKKADCKDCDGDCDNCPKKADCKDCDGTCDHCAAASSKTDDPRA